ncbi:hypothetical protein AB4Z54_57370, partial [Streptomyces sp. MCAF7]
ARLRDQPRTAEEELRPEQSEAGRAEEQSRSRARLLSAMEAVSPGFISPEALRKMNEELDRDPVHSPVRPEDRAQDALPRVMQEALAAVRNNDPDLLDSALGRIVDVSGWLPEGHELDVMAEAMRSLLVGGAEALGGNLQDAELGHRLIESVAGQLAETPSSPSLSVLVRVSHATSRLDRAQQAEDLAELD